MNNYSDKHPDVENIDLANTYTENDLKELKNDINNLRLRAATFFGFAGLLLRFIIELSNSEPSYLLTKIVAFLTCFSSIVLLALVLRGEFIPTNLTYKELIEKYFLPNPILEVKKKILENNIEELDFHVQHFYRILNLLHQATICLVVSAFFFMSNSILVSFFGQ